MNDKQSHKYIENDKPASHSYIFSAHLRNENGTNLLVAIFFLRHQGKKIKIPKFIEGAGKMLKNHWKIVFTLILCELPKPNYVRFECF